MKIEKNKKKIQFKIENNCIGKIEDEINIEGIISEDQNDISIFIFPPYILKAANEISLKNNIQIKINERQKPILFFAQTDEKNMIYIVMPMIGV